MTGRIFATLIIFSMSLVLPAQVRVRLLTGSYPQYTIFRVVSGSYELDDYARKPIVLPEGRMILVAKKDNKLAVKVENLEAFSCDSVILRAAGSDCRFNIYETGKNNINRIFSGDLQCIAENGGVFFINICDIESYIVGVVKAEGGNGKTRDYFRVQATITRTYTYRHLGRHLSDGYNLCDDVHCQVFSGLATDTLIRGAVADTRDEVIVTPDSNLIISAFHSNCGGETSPSEYAWPSSQPYLTKVIDPYCTSTKNATWKKEVDLNSWASMLKGFGYKGITDSAAIFNWPDTGRVRDYRVGDFSVPFSRIRSELSLRSAWFGIKASGDTLILSGRGYGHGIGLCQEGAIAMASKGIGYKEIIRFYYPGVTILRIGDAKKVIADPLTIKN